MPIIFCLLLLNEFLLLLLRLIFLKLIDPFSNSLHYFIAYLE